MPLAPPVTNAVFPARSSMISSLLQLATSDNTLNARLAHGRESVPGSCENSKSRRRDGEPDCDDVLRRQLSVEEIRPDARVIAADFAAGAKARVSGAEFDRRHLGVEQVPRS